MNRRSFLSNISAAVVGCYLGVGVNLKKIDITPPEYIPNPVWETTEYQGVFLCGKGYWKAMRVGPPPKTFNREDYA